MADETRTEHTVVINGIEHTVLLTDEEAKAQGATKSAAPTPKDPPNKARSPRGKHE